MYLENTLEQVSTKKNFLYSKGDLKNLFPSVTDENLNMVLSRAVKKSILSRVCKGIYVYAKAEAEKSDVLYRTATKLRADCMNYISLESVLSEHSLISQQLLGWITVMTTGRSGIIQCGKFGTIEFVHTAKKIPDIAGNLFLDEQSKMLKANPAQAYKDMVDAKRTTLDLVDKAELEKEISR